MVAMSMSILFIGLLGYTLFRLVKGIFEAFNARIRKVVNGLEVASDAFKYSVSDDGSIKNS